MYLTQELLEKRIKTPEEITKEIDAVNADQVKLVAKELFKPEGLNLAIIGPYQDEEKLLGLLNIYTQ